MNHLLQKLMLGGSSVALIAASISGAQAQDIEEVVVSASRVTIQGYTQPTPVTVVGVAQLEKDAYANIADSVRQLPQVNSPPTSFGASQGAGSPGTAGLNLINLRGLGTGRTLILFDRQRVSNSNITGGVDVTTLPSAVISRVDVVTGGASAVWGSDAVAGVVNFVLNKNFSGFKASAEAGSTWNNLHRHLAASATWGDDILGGRGHFIVSANVNHRPDTVVLTNEKWFRGAYMVSNPAYVATNGQPQLIVANDVGLANASQGGLITSSPAGVGVGAAPANALRGIQFVGNGIPERVNFGNITGGVLSNGGSLTAQGSEAPWQTLAGPSNTLTVFAYGKYSLTDNIVASLQLNYGYFTGKGDAQSFQNNALVVKSDNAYIPASVRAAMQAGGIANFTMGTLNGNNFDNLKANGKNYTEMAATALAPATTFNHRALTRGVFTLEGTLGSDWSWSAYYENSTTRFWVPKVLGNVIIANLAAAQDAVVVTAANRGSSSLPLGSVVCRSSLPGQAAVVVGKVTAQPNCIPINSFGTGVVTPAASAYVQGNWPDFERMKLDQDVVELSMSGVLPWELPAGKVGVAFGGDYRKEAGRNVATQLGADAGYATANYSNFPAAAYNVMEGFLEVNAPILKDTIVDSLDFSAAGRITSYSTSGMVETWKLGLASQVNEDIRLRTTWSVDIRAPTLFELFAPSSVNTGNCNDPKTGLTQSCVTNVIGNPALKPEVARTISGGIALTPRWIDGLTLSADWYSINLTGQIANVSATLIQSTCRANWLATGTLTDPLCSKLEFGGAVGTQGPALSRINNSPINQQSLATSGLDTQINYTMDFWEGTLDWQSTANYVDQITLTTPGQKPNNYAGVLGAGRPAQSTGAPKWKGVISADYKTGPYSFTVQTRWYGSSILNNEWNDGNLARAATANMISSEFFHVDPVAYLDLRGSYKWNDGIQFYGAIDNFTNAPPPLVPGNSGSIQSNGGPIHSSNQFDLLGRAFRLGVRFTY